VGSLKAVLWEFRSARGTTLGTQENAAPLATFSGTLTLSTCIPYHQGRTLMARCGAVGR
jgi:hypothetical protein